MSKQNITLSLEKDLIKKARALAAREDTSVTQLLARYLEKVVNNEEQYQAAKKNALLKLKKGYHLGGKGIIDRDELHAR